ncbi:MAG TPA: hypothetical protein VGI99_15510 [Gemmataceae bacterium]|jgi:hypothetical protein
MPRAAILTALAIMAFARPARADTLPLIGLPTGYTPGVAVTFDLTAPGLNGLTDYSLAFTVMSGPTTAPPDLTISAAPPATGYLFPDASNFFTETDSLGQNQLSFIIQDTSSVGGVSTVLGVNDRLAIVTLAPGATLSGPITVTFTDNTFDTSRDVSFPLPAAFVIAELPPTTAVPGPPAWLLLGLGGLCLAGRQRLRRAA